MIGRTLDNRYFIQRQIGQGGMGAVYEARHVGTNRRVAVKVILREAMLADHVARFQREARIVGAVESQHITQVFDTGVDPATGCPYIAMEFLDGEDAHALLKKVGPLPVDLVLRIGVQALSGLARAHDAGVVHRDIKSGNMFLHRNEPGHRLVKLLDFGIAKVGQELGDGGLTKTGTLLGSPLYMSPEQARGQRVDPRSDLFSLGITLYELLGGRRPNEEITQLGELIFKVCSEPARWLQDVAPWVPAELAGMVHRSLAIDPAARYQSAAEMAAALRSMLPNGQSQIDESMLVPLGPELRARAAPRGSPHEHTGNPRAISVSGVSVTGPGMSVTGAGMSATGAGMSATGTAVAPPPKRSSMGLVIGGAAALLVAGGVAAVFFLRGQGGQGVDGPAAQGPTASPTAAAVVTAAPGASSSSSASTAAEPSPSGSAAPDPSVTASASSSPTAAVTQAAAPSTTVKAPPTKTAKPVTTTKPKSDDETSRK